MRNYVLSYPGLIYKRVTCSESAGALGLICHLYW